MFNRAMAYLVRAIFFLARFLVSRLYIIASYDSLALRGGGGGGVKPGIMD